MALKIREITNMRVKRAMRKLIISPIITLDVTPNMRTLIMKEINQF